MDAGAGVGVGGGAVGLGGAGLEGLLVHSAENAAAAAKARTRMERFIDASRSTQLADCAQLLRRTKSADSALDERLFQSRRAGVVTSTAQDVSRFRKPSAKCG